MYAFWAVDTVYICSVTLEYIMAIIIIIIIIIQNFKDEKNS